MYTIVNEQYMHRVYGLQINDYSEDKKNYRHW